MIAVVVPSNRPEALERWLAAWADELRRAECVYYPIRDEPATWAAIQRDLGGAAWIIPRRSDAIRSYGFWLAARDGADLIVTLDDDCLPEEPLFFLMHHLGLQSRVPRWESSITTLPARGMPIHTGRARVALSVGGWTGVPDLSGEEQLAGHWERTPWRCVETVVAPGTYMPLSGMNLAFPAWLGPIMYFGLQGWSADEPWGVDRFGDIWCGVVAKRILDHLGLRVRVGLPRVRHERLSDPLVNRERERAGAMMHEDFWPLVDRTALGGRSLSGCYAQLAYVIGQKPGRYWRSLGEAMLVWGRLWERLKLEPGEGWPCSA